METEQYGYEIYALKRSFGTLKGDLEFPKVVNERGPHKTSKVNYKHIQSSKSLNMQKSVSE